MALASKRSRGSGRGGWWLLGARRGGASGARKEPRGEGPGYRGRGVVFDSKELTISQAETGFAGTVVMRCAAILKHKEKGHFNLNTQAN